MKVLSGCGRGASGGHSGNASSQMPFCDSTATDDPPSHIEGSNTTALQGGNPALLRHCNSNHWDVTSQQIAWWGCSSIDPQDMNHSRGGNKHLTSGCAVKPGMLRASGMAAD